MVKYCSKCGAELKDSAVYCEKCETKLNSKESNNLFNFLHNKKVILSIIIVIILILIICTSAFILNQNKDSNIKTHEFNYSNKIIFNISDELTNKTDVESLIIGNGVSYTYKNNLTNMLGGLAHSDGTNDYVESADNTDYYKKVASNKTQQGLETHIYKYDGTYGDEYIVYINLKNYTFTESDSFTGVYDYFSGTFDTLEEAQIFIKTFKIINTDNQNSSDTNTNSNGNNAVSDDSGTYYDESTGERIPVGQIKLGADDHHWIHRGNNYWERID